MHSILNMLRSYKHGANRKLSALTYRLGEKHIVSKTRGMVASGIFMGTKLLNKQVFGSIAAKYLGTYEMELHDYFKAAMGRHPKVICNIGAAEGYYAMGLARFESVEKVIVYEALTAGRELIENNARLNSMEDIIHVNGECDADRLTTLLSNNNIDLMLIDIEGGELDILTPENLSLLKKTELLIESHDFCRPNCIEKLKSMFVGTHDLQIFTGSPRVSLDFPLRSFLPGSLKEKLMDEARPDEMNWLACIPKANTASLSPR